MTAAWSWLYASIISFTMELPIGFFSDCIDLDTRRIILILPTPGYTESHVFGCNARIPSRLVQYLSRDNQWPARLMIVLSPKRSWQQTAISKFTKEFTNYNSPLRAVVVLLLCKQKPYV